MGALQSCLPFLKSKVPTEALTDLVASGAAEVKEAVLNEVEKLEGVVEKAVEGLKLHVPDEIAAIVPKAVIDEAVKVVNTVVEKVTDEVVATVDKAKDVALAMVVEKAKDIGSATVVEKTKEAKELAAHVKEMEKLD